MHSDRQRLSKVLQTCEPHAQQYGLLTDSPGIGRDRPRTITVLSLRPFRKPKRARPLPQSGSALYERHVYQIVAFQPPSIPVCHLAWALYLSSFCHTSDDVSMHISLHEAYLSLVRSTVTMNFIFGSASHGSNAQTSPFVAMITILYSEWTSDMSPYPHEPDDYE